MSNSDRNPNWSPMWRIIIGAVVGQLVTGTVLALIFYGTAQAKFAEQDRINARLDRMDREGTTATIMLPAAVANNTARISALEKQQSEMAADIRWLRAWAERRGSMQ